MLWLRGKAVQFTNPSMYPFTCTHAINTVYLCFGCFPQHCPSPNIVCKILYRKIVSSQFVFIKCFYLVLPGANGNSCDH